MSEFAQLCEPAAAQTGSGGDGRGMEDACRSHRVGQHTQSNPEGLSPSEQICPEKSFVKVRRLSACVCF